jgi:hypothetical protein
MLSIQKTIKQLSNLLLEILCTVCTPSFYSTMIRRSECSYASCYCEENAVLLAHRLRDLPGETCVAFISNSIKCVPVWHQAAASSPQDAVWWDYHVIVLHRQPEDPWFVYDLDTLLSWPCLATKYVDDAFRPGAITATHVQWLRVIGAEECISRFSSDRGHMRNADGSFKMVPPTYAPLQGPAARTSHELTSFLDFSLAIPARAPGRKPLPPPLLVAPDPWYGDLLSISEFQAWFC